MLCICQNCTHKWFHVRLGSPIDCPACGAINWEKIDKQEEKENAHITEHNTV